MLFLQQSYTVLNLKHTLYTKGKNAPPPEKEEDRWWIKNKKENRRGVAGKVSRNEISTPVR